MRWCVARQNLVELSVLDVAALLQHHFHVQGESWSNARAAHAACAHSRAL